MKPLLLTMSGFGTFSEKCTIDFTKFGSNGIFLITGSTGSGKTTIFDAVTFALFGETSSSHASKQEKNSTTSRCSSDMKSDFIKDGVCPFVELEFEHCDKKYKLRRTLKYFRVNLRKKLTEIKANAELTLPDGNIVSGFDAVTSKVEEILAIECSQWRRIAMIAQGEFTQLLNENSEERRKIFHNIFGTAFYEEIQNKLKEEYKNVKDSLKSTDSLLENITAGIIFNPEKQQVLYELKDSGRFPELADWLEKLNSEDNNSLLTLKEQDKRLVTEHDSLLERKLYAQQTETIRQQLENANSEYSRLLADNGNVNDMEVLAEKNEKYILIVFPLVQQLNEKRALYAKTQADLQHLGGLEVQLSEEMKTTERQLETAKSETEKIPALQISANKIREQLPQYHHYTVLISQLENLRLSLENSGKKLESLLALQAELEQREQQIKTKTESKSQLLIEAENTGNNITNNEKLFSDFKNLKELMHSYKVQAMQFRKLKEEYQEKEAICISAQQLYNEEEQKYSRELAGIIAEKLEANQPCPVCGSRSHPHKALKSESTLTAEQIKALKSDYERKQTEFEKIKQTCISENSHIQHGLEEVKRIFSSLTGETDLTFPEIKNSISKHLSELEEKLKKLRSRKAEISKAIAEITSLEAEHAENAEKLEETAQLIKQEETAVNDLEKNIAVAEKEKSGISLDFADEVQANNEITRLDNLISSINIKAETAEKKQREISEKYTQTKTLVNQKEQDIKQTSADVNSLTAEINSKFVPLGLSADFRPLSESQIKDIKKRITDHKTKVSNLMHDIEKFSEELKLRQSTDIEEIMGKISEIELSQKVVKEETEKISFRLKTNRTIQKQVKELSQKRSDILEQLGLIAQLSDTANGNINGKENISFEVYIQTVYFERVILYANKRLEIMTDGRYSLLRKTTRQGRTKSALGLDVFDAYTGKVRSVKSLSGGETFKSALALALGLSDVIQENMGGVKIDTLFIDEGFGSLDADSLEQAVRVLSELSDGNRLIGIISHVSELQNRIDKKIIVSGDGKSGSHIKIITD